MHFWWEYKLIQPLWRTVRRFPNTRNKEIIFFAKLIAIIIAIPLLGIYHEKIITEKDTCIPMCIAALFTIVRTWKQPRCPLTDE